MMIARVAVLPLVLLCAVPAPALQMTYNGMSNATYVDHRKDPRGYFYLANYYVGEECLQLKRYDQAVAAFQLLLDPKADPILPKFGLAYIDLGSVYDKLEQHEAALKSFQTAIGYCDQEKDPVWFYEANFRAGMDYLILKRDQEALAAFRLVLQYQASTDDGKELVAMARDGIKMLKAAPQPATDNRSFLYKVGEELAKQMAQIPPSQPQRRDQTVTPNDCVMIGATLAVAAHSINHLIAGGVEEDAFQKQVSPLLGHASAMLQEFSSPKFTKEIELLDAFRQDVDRQHASAKKQYADSILKLLPAYLLDNVESVGKGYRWYVVLGLLLGRMDVAPLQGLEKDVDQAKMAAIASIVDWAKSPPANVLPPLMGAVRALEPYAHRPQLTAADRTAITDAWAYIHSGMWQWSKDPYQLGKHGYAFNNDTYASAKPAPVPQAPAFPAQSVGPVINGLTWTANDSRSHLNWDAAVAYCKNLSLGGHSDWRLPTADELGGMFDATQSGTFVLAGQTERYHIKGGIQLSGWMQWSGTPTGPGTAWLLNFSNGARINNVTYDPNHWALCVRRAGN